MERQEQEVNEALGAGAWATSVVAKVLADAQPYQFVTEAQLQEQVWRALRTQLRLTKREVALTDGRSRIDFLVHLRWTIPVGVELKIKGGAPKVARQLLRYARSGDIAGLVLVSTRPQHREVTTLLEGCPVPIAFVLLQGGAL